ncbi:MAG: hypothetical protein EXR98_18680 [Gemmataceae bacterium]|nr:hypothetical protein [Gemmataceae bacterium]
MATQNPSSARFTPSRPGWRWVLVLVAGMAWLSVGCNPQMLSMIIMPFTDTNVDPEYKLFAKDKEITLVILTNFARPEHRPDLQGADAELAIQIAQAFRNRCTTNKHKIKIVSDAQVRSRQLNQRAGGQLGAVEIGAHFKADYVLDVTINSLGLYEKDLYPPMYRGRTDLAVSMYKVKAADDDGHKVFGKEMQRGFPSGPGPIDATSMTASWFRTTFLTKVANDVAKTFIGYPPEERRVLD